MISHERSHGPRARLGFRLAIVSLFAVGAVFVLARPMTARASALPVAAHGSSAAVGEDIRDIHGPLALPVSRPRWWLAAALTAGLITVGAATAFARRRRKPLSPYARAVAELEAQRALVGERSLTAREFCIAVSEIVRRYVEEAFAVRAAHRTTDELLVDLMRDTSPVARQRVELGAFLRACDLAKFAGWLLEPEEMMSMLDSAETFMRATQPPPGPGARPMARHAQEASS